jgi:26S proteasome regulatory subunit T1
MRGRGRNTFLRRLQDKLIFLLLSNFRFQECAKYMSSEQISSFLDAAIRNRIAVRLIAEQHIVLSRALQNPERANADLGIGVVNMALSPVEMIRMCGSFVSELCEATLGAAPPIVIDGATDDTFACVFPHSRFPVHLVLPNSYEKQQQPPSYVTNHVEYILTEVLKNAFRATVEHHRHHHRRQQHNGGDGSGPPLPLPPVLITIVPPPRLPGINKPATLSLRIRDQGGGVAPANMEHIFSYAFTTAGRRRSSGHGRGSSHDGDAGDGGGPYAAQQHGGGGGAAGGVDIFHEITSKGIETGLGTIAGLGFGLPMSRLYAQ